jgi:homoprotocatechuate degradation regulator HpaR
MTQRPRRTETPAGAPGEPGPGLVRDFSQSLPMALLRAREAVMARLRPMLRAHGVTEQQWRVLRTLEHADGLEAAQLARQVFLMRPSLTRILRDLQARGLVVRHASPAGLRRSQVFITPKGVALIEDTRPDAAAANAEIERIYGPEALAALKRELFVLEEGLTGRSDR